MCIEILHIHASHKIDIKPHIFMSKNPSKIRCASKGADIIHRLTVHFTVRVSRDKHFGLRTDGMRADERIPGMTYNGKSIYAIQKVMAHTTYECFA